MLCDAILLRNRIIPPRLNDAKTVQRLLRHYGEFDLLVESPLLSTHTVSTDDNNERINGFNITVISNVSDKGLSTTTEIFIQNPAVYIPLYRDDIVGVTQGLMSGASFRRLFNTFKELAPLSNSTSALPEDSKFVFFLASTRSEDYPFIATSNPFCCHKRQDWNTFGFGSNHSTAVPTVATKMAAYFKRVHHFLAADDRRPADLTQLQRQWWRSRIYFFAYHFSQLPSELRDKVVSFPTASYLGAVVDERSYKLHYDSIPHVTQMPMSHIDNPLRVPLVPAYQYGAYFPPEGVSEIVAAPPKAVCGEWGSFHFNNSKKAQTVLIDIRTAESQCGTPFNFTKVVTEAGSANNTASSLLFYGFDEDAIEGGVTFLGSELDWPVPTAQALVTSVVIGESLRARLGAMFILGMVSTNTTGFSIDRSNKARWMGAYIFPSIQNIGYMPLYQEHLSDVAEQLEELSDATHYTLFEKGTNLHGSGYVGPHTAIMMTRGLVKKMVIEMSISCADYSNEASCPPWDHVVQLYGCCGQTPCNPYTEGREIGRWITAFGRSIGHWLSDITPLSPILMSSEGNMQTCNFTAFTVPWAGQAAHAKWLIETKLIVQTETADERAVAVTATPSPSILFPWTNHGQNPDTSSIFHWYVVNLTYAENFPAFAFPPASMRSGYTKGRVVAYLTGHGGDPNCAEFCAVVHRFTITNAHTQAEVATLWANFTLPISDGAEGCATAMKVRSGVVPNEHGTWYFGRNGWCNGRNVELWVSDYFSLLSGMTYAPLLLTYTALTCLGASMTDPQCKPYKPPSPKVSFPASLLVNMYISLE